MPEKGSADNRQKHCFRQVQLYGWQSQSRSPRGPDDSSTSKKDCSVVVISLVVADDNDGVVVLTVNEWQLCVIILFGSLNRSLNRDPRRTSG